MKEKHPEYLEGKDLQDFLSYLAVEKRVPASTQNQAVQKNLLEAQGYRAVIVTCGKRYELVI